jgi:KDO2-lipid IV(A) lauroyltransferase
MSPLFHLLGRLPLGLLHALGAALGWLAFLASPTYRRHLRANLALAYPGEAARRLLPAVVGHAGRGVAELPRIWMRSRDKVVGLVTRVTGWELVEEAHRRGEGILFLTPHLGCFEVTAQYYAAHGPITVLYRPPKRAWLQPLIEAGRAGPNLSLAPADLSGVRLLLRALRRREAVGMLPDQVPGMGEGLWSPFFGRPAYTMTLAARLTEQAGTRVIMAYAERLHHGAGYHLHLAAPRPEIAGSLEERTRRLNEALEELIRRCPEQYLWGYNRYKVPAGAEPPPC